MKNRSSVIPSGRVVPHGHNGGIDLLIAAPSRISLILDQIRIVIDGAAEIFAQRTHLFGYVATVVLHLLGLELALGIKANCRPINVGITLLHGNKIGF